MADPRRFASINYGQPGRLTYIPRADPAQGPGLLHTSRFTSTAPHFQLVGSVAELYPPSKTSSPEFASQQWTERRAQNRWLLKAHPEAFMGVASYDTVLSESMSRFRDTDHSASNRPLLAVGEITDVTDHSRPKGAQVLAAATGHAGELLRMVHMDETQWKWEEDAGSVLDLSVVDVRDLEDEVVWGSDGLPISQIKFANSLSPSGAIRWLIVQKQTSTVILRPEYHGTPVADDGYAEWPRQQRPSRIEPNLILSISHQQTGGNAHCDVAFRPPSQGRPPQIAIIDECGYWSVWDILGTLQTGKNTLRVNLSKTGHILEGLLDKIPARTVYAAEAHGILFAGPSSSHASAIKVEEGTETDGEMGSHLLLWNHEHFRALDLDLNMLLPKLPSFKTKRGLTDWILDVRSHPNDDGQVFVLTSENIFWVSIKNSDGRHRMLSKPSVLSSCSHPRGGDRSLQMNVCQMDSANPRSAMVFLNSPKSSQLVVYWFSLSADIELPQWHRHVTELDMGGDGVPENAIQTLAFQPAQLTRSSSGLALSRIDETRFFQGKFLTRDLAVRYCICSAVVPSAAELTLPSKRINWSKSEQEKKRKRKRKRFLEQMAEAFAIPAGFTDIDVDGLVQLGREKTIVEKLPTPYESKPRGPMLVDMRRVCTEVERRLQEGSDSPGVGLPASLVAMIQHTLQQGLENGQLPLTTWREITRGLVEPVRLEEPDIDTNEAMQNLQDDLDPAAAIVTLNPRMKGDSATAPTRLHDIDEEYSQLWRKPVEAGASDDMRQLGRVWIADLARETLLSSYGIVVQHTALFGDGPLPMVEESSQRSQPYSSRLDSSQALPSSIPSSPPSAVFTSTPDAAFLRLQLLAPSIRQGVLGTSKPSSVLDYWPAERGIDTSDYISSVAIASDKQFEEARQRLRRKTARRQAQGDKVRFISKTGRAAQGGEVRTEQEAFASTPMGPAQIMSSQQQLPASSQSQGFLGPQVTMSQPVSGIFGDRKKVKKSKKRSGFR